MILLQQTESHKTAKKRPKNLKMNQTAKKREDIRKRESRGKKLFRRIWLLFTTYISEAFIKRFIGREQEKNNRNNFSALKTNKTKTIIVNFI